MLVISVIYLQTAIDKMTKRMQKTLEGTKFSGCPITSVAARPGGGEVGDLAPLNIEDLIKVFLSIFNMDCCSIFLDYFHPRIRKAQYRHLFIILPLKNLKLFHTITELRESTD